MNHYIAIVNATLVATGPIFFLILLGIALKRLGLMNEQFVATSSRLVFTVFLPVLLFTIIVKVDVSSALNWDVLGFGLAATLGAFAISWLVAVAAVRERFDRGVFVQGAFRGNLGVIGIALSASAYGEQGLAIAALPMAAMTVLYNVLAVVVLSFYAGSGAFSWRTTLGGIVRNPLIVSIVAALCVATLKIPIPEVALSTGAYLGSMALPLAVLGSGAGLSLKVLTDTSYVTGMCAALKLVAIPLIFTALAWWWGLDGVTLGVMFLLLASPTAAASFVMAQAAGGNAPLAANIIMTTTLVSVVTISVGLFLLKAMGLA